MTEHIDDVLNALVEELAALEHRRWSHWQRYLHDSGERQPNGALLLPPELVSRWERQIVATYDELSEDERESDREQVRGYLPVICSALEFRRHA
jgi:hypothetical protein